MSRTALLVGESSIARLRQSHVLVVGVGGVGAYAAEMLVRAGVGAMTLVDADCVAESNINRQLIALHSTVGQAKTDVLARRLRDIAPALQLHTEQRYIDPENADALLDGDFSFVVDAIDTVAPKTALLLACLRRRIPVVSSMGAGARLDPSAVAYGDIADTCYCGLAREVRRRLRAAGIRRGLKVVFSTEPPSASAVLPSSGERNKRSTIGTISYLPAVFGCYLAAYVIRKLTEA